MKLVALFILMFNIHAFASVIGDKIVTSKGAVFERVPYAGFKNQTTAWKLPNGSYLSDTLPGLYKSCITPAPGERSWGDRGVCAVEESRSTGSRLIYKGTSHKNRYLIIDSEAIRACKNLSATTDAKVHLPSIMEYTEFLKNFDYGAFFPARMTPWDAEVFLSFTNELGQTDMENRIFSTTMSNGYSAAKWVSVLHNDNIRYNRPPGELGQVDIHRGRLLSVRCIGH